MIDWTLLLTSALTLMCWSMLYKENIFFTIAERTYIGIILGYTIYRYSNTLYGSILVPLVGGKTEYLIVLFFGALILTSLSKRYIYFSRWSMALLAGVGTGVAIRGGIYPMVITQIKEFAKPIIVSSPAQSINNILIIIGTLTSLSYFFFTTKQMRALQYSSKIGQVFIMALLGMGFAGSIIDNTSFAISLMMDFTQPVAWWPIPIAIALIAFDYYREKRKIK